VLKLVNGLDPRRVRSAVCSTRPGGALGALLAPHVPLFELRRREGNDPALVWRLYRLFRRERPHVVHTHAWGTLLEGLTAARLARVPLVVHGEHGTLQLRPRQRWCQQQAWARVDRLLSVSSRLAERMAEATKFPVDRIQVLRNGVDLGRFGLGSRVAARDALGLPLDATVAGAVGRLVPVKDHVLLVEAAALLQRQGLRPLVAIAGEGPSRSAIEERAAALGVADRLRLLGHRPDVETVFAALDVFVQPSRSEGLSNTIMEAMAASLPVVATQVGGADELVVDGVTGLLVQPGVAESLAGALGRLLSVPADQARMGTAGRSRVETEFELSVAVRRYERLYVDLARGCAAVPGRLRAALATDCETPRTEHECRG
jgi:L-malate glycosyltransferase